jgi:5-methylcytosine-specific restriction enzyme A
MPPRAFRPYAVDPVQRRVRFDAERADDPIRKLYQTKAWRSARRMVLARDPFCVIHPVELEPALSRIVHHVIAARKYVDQHGGDETFFFDESNLLGVCKSCHDATTARECGFAPKGAAYS